jgi:hypothetical protein
MFVVPGGGSDHLLLPKAFFIRVGLAGQDLLNMEKKCHLSLL